MGGTHRRHDPGRGRASAAVLFAGRNFLESWSRAAGGGGRLRSRRCLRCRPARGDNFALCQRGQGGGGGGGGGWGRQSLCRVVVSPVPPPLPVSPPSPHRTPRRAPPRDAAQPRIPGPGSSTLGRRSRETPLQPKSSRGRGLLGGGRTPHPPTPPHIHPPLRRPRQPVTELFFLPKRAYNRLFHKSAHQGAGGWFLSSFDFPAFPYNRIRTAFLGTD